MDNREYIDIFNALLAEYNPRLLPVDPERFSRTRELLGCDELTALFIMGTQVPPDSACLQNVKLPGINNYMRAFAEPIVTVGQVAEEHLLPIDDVSVVFQATSSDSFRMWYESLRATWDDRRFGMLIHDVVDVVRDEGMGRNEAYAVRIRTDTMADDEIRWLFVGQRVKVTGGHWNGPIDAVGTIGHISPADGLARVAWDETETDPEHPLQCLFRLCDIIPTDDHVPPELAQRTTHQRAERHRSPRLDSREALERGGDFYDSTEDVLKRILEEYYPSMAFQPFDTGRLLAILWHSGCDAETAFYVLGTQIEARYALVVNRLSPKSADRDSFAFAELPKDVLTIGNLSYWSMREPEELRKGFFAISYDLTSDAGRHYAESLRTARNTIREHGIIYVRRNKDMGPNEACGIGITHDEAVLSRDDAGIADATKVLLLGRRARVICGESAGLEGRITMIAPVDGTVTLTSGQQGESKLSIIVPIDAVEPL